MRVSHADQLAKTGAEAWVEGFARHQSEVDSVTAEHFLRQPARAAAAVLPYIFENIRHLKPLREGRGDGGQRRAVTADLRRIVAKQLGEHFADYPCHVIAVVVQIARLGKASEARGELKTRHAVAHQLDAAP